MDNYYCKNIKRKRENEFVLDDNKFKIIIDTLNYYLGKNEWVLSGSKAIKLYLEYCKLENSLRAPRDVDIIYINNQNLNPKNIGDFKPVQKSSENSMTFKKDDGLSFDIIETKKSKKYYEINGYKLESPDNMIHRYQDSKSSRGKDKEGKLKSAEDNLKLEVLYKIKECIDIQHLELKNISVNKKNISVDKENITPKQFPSFDNEPPSIRRFPFSFLFDN